MSPVGRNCKQKPLSGKNVSATKLVDVSNICTPTNNTSN